MNCLALFIIALKEIKVVHVVMKLKRITYKLLLKTW